MTLFQGCGTAIVTPFNEDTSVDFNALEKLVQFQLENDVDALVVCGTTGEASTLKDEEQLEVIRFVVDLVKKKVPVIAGAGSNDTQHGIELCIGSQKVGADACLLVTPYYNKTTQKGLYEHFAAHAKSIDIPIVLYNVPGRTGLNIDAKTAYELSKIENIVAIKEASGNIAHIMDLAYLCNGRLDIYSGNDDHIVPILSVGGKGVISVISNIAPKKTHDLVMSYLSGDLAKSLQLQLEMLPLVKALFCEVNPIPVKTALKYMGFGGYHYRQPLTTMEKAHEDLLVQELKNYGLYPA